MKYFTQEMWWGLDPRKPAQFKKVAKKWDCNQAAYLKQLAVVAKALSKRNALFFTRQFTRMTLHDADFENICIKEIRPSKSSSSTIRSVELTVTSEGHRYRLRYADVSNIAIKTANPPCYPSGIPMDVYFGDWGYDELTVHRNGTFQHSILFSCFTELSISFRKFSYSKEKESNKRLQSTSH